MKCLLGGGQSRKLQLSNHRVPSVKTAGNGAHTPALTLLLLLQESHTKDNVHSSLWAASRVKVLAKSLFNVIPARGMRRAKDQTWGIITWLSALSLPCKDRNKLTPPHWFTSCHMERTILALLRLNSAPASVHTKEKYYEKTEGNFVRAQKAF